MKQILIKAEQHSDYKANEYPKCFYWKEERLEIKEIIDRWYQGNNDPERPATNYFKVITVFEKKYILKHDIENDKWYLVY